MSATLSTRKTSELRAGDVVRMHGARVRIAFESHRQADADIVPGRGPVIAFVGVIENADDPAVDPFMLRLAAGTRAHRVANGLEVPEGTEPLWSVQGNDLATWTVET